MNSPFDFINHFKSKNNQVEQRVNSEDINVWSQIKNDFKAYSFITVLIIEKNIFFAPKILEF